MGSAASKATRTLPKSSLSAGAKAEAPVTARSGVPTSRPAPSPQSVAASDASRSPGEEALRSAAAIGESGRQASPLHRDSTVGPVPGRSEGASDSKDAAIRRDAFDPHFVTQLNNLGPVQLPPGQPSLSAPTTSSSARAASQPSQMTRILQARQEREDRLQAEKEAQESRGASRTTSKAVQSKVIDAPTLSMLLDERKACRTQADLDRLALEYDFDMQSLAVLTKRFNSPSIGARLDSPEEEQARREDNNQQLPPRLLAVWTEPALESRPAIEGGSSA